MNGYWNVPNLWQGATAYIIGGGPSLRSFDFNKLKGKPVIGCNDAYLLGKDIVKICCFGDSAWYYIHREKLLDSNIPCVTNDNFLMKEPIHVTRKKTLSLGEGEYLGWFHNTGAMAINLALSLGAKRIYLLGYDMGLGQEGQANWHPNLKDEPNAKHYTKFMRYFPLLAKQIKVKYPEVAIINSNAYSKLDVFHKEKIECLPL